MLRLTNAADPMWSAAFAFSSCEVICPLTIGTHTVVPSWRVGSRDDGRVDIARPTSRLIVASVTALLAIIVNAAIGSAAAKPKSPTKTTPKTTPKSPTKTTPKAATAKPTLAQSKAVKKPLAGRSTTTIRRNTPAKSGVATAVLGATVLPTVSTAPTTTQPTASVAPTPTTTTTPTTPPTTTLPVTTTTSAVASFEVIALNVRGEALAGATATFSVVIAQRGEPVPVSLSVIGLPSGTSASVGPNPATGQSVIRIAVPSNAIVADYPLRILGTGGSAQSWANVTLGVLPATTTTTAPATTTTVDTSTLPASFGFSVTPDGKTLVIGGQVQYEIIPIYETGYNGSIEYFVSGLPDGVWFGFSQKVTTTKTVLWLSSTVPMKAGKFPFTITGVSKGLKKSGELTVTIG